MLHKVFPDMEKARSIFNMSLDRMDFVKSVNINYPNILVENYYEIIKEFSSALLLLNGFKFVGENAHKELINSLKKYANFDDEIIYILQDLRIKRNKGMYDGKRIDISYVKNKKDVLLEVIDKLKKIVENELK